MTTATLPTLSVIIACRNSGRTLAETLQAVADQCYDGWWEVVVVDNGSTDDTVDVARGFEGRLPLSVLTVPTPGFQARALNHGMSKTKGEVIVFLDSDDVIGPDYLTQLAQAMAAAPFVGAAMDVELLNPPSVRSRRAPLQQDRIDSYCNYLPAVVGAAMGGRREPLEAVAGFDEDLPTQHDLDISWRLSAAGYQATLVPQATLHYRYRTGVRAIFEQERGYGVGEVVLYRKFRAAGMPGRTLLQAVASYARIGKALVTAWQPGGAARLATHAGMALGRLQGSVQYRTAYL